MIAIVGPTASGKSHVGQLLVEYLNYSIINFDSCQFYKELSVLTAVPNNLQEHYLYSFISYSDKINVLDWVQLAIECVDQLGNLKKIAFIGGTGLYLKVLNEGIDLLPDFSEKVLEIEALSFEQVKKWLLKVDSKVLDFYFDERRLRKFLAFYLQYGYSLLEAYDGRFKKKFIEKPIYIIALIPDKKILHERIYKRLYSEFDLMVEEVKRCSVNVPEVIGFSEISLFLNGDITKENCLEMIFIRTKQYAKRQITFIRNVLRVKLVFNDYVSLFEFLKNNKLS